MTNILKLQKATNNSLGILACRTSFKENEAGPTDFLNYIYISGDKVSIPHVDHFNVLDDVYDLPINPDDRDIFNVNGKEIVLKGNTREYLVNVCGTDVITSLKQYFLNNKTRDGIQYLIYVDNFDMVIPGVVYDKISGEALGYIKSYEMDEQASFSIELPYNSSVNFSDYVFKTKVSISGEEEIIEWEAKEITDNIVTLSSLNREDLVKDENGAIVFTIENGSSVGEFPVYPTGAFSGNEQEITVKEVNEFCDYIIASRVKDETYGGLALVEKKLTTIERQQVNTPVVVKDGDRLKIEWQTKVYFTPTMFHTLINDSPSEQAKNMTPTIYKTPAALVNLGNEKIFMTNVVSLSINKIETI